jgi:hypothetical protein
MRRPSLRVLHGFRVLRVAAVAACAAAGVTGASRAGAQAVAASSTVPGGVPSGAVASADGPQAADSVLVLPDPERPRLARLLDAGTRAFQLPPLPVVRAVVNDDPRAYAGYDGRGAPRYVRRRFTEYERSLLRWAYGIEEPNRLWLPDTTTHATLRYDTRLVDGVVLVARVGYPSARYPGETWDAFADRLAMGRREEFRRHGTSTYSSLDALAPDARACFARLLEDARRAGFRVRVRETLRSPERQAFLYSAADGRTYTATSSHMVGRAIDLEVGDGRLSNPATVEEWVAFRRWVLEQRTVTGARFQLIGGVDRTWDWPHVELEDDPNGFRTVDELLAAAAAKAAQAEQARVAKAAAAAAAGGAP